MLFCLKSILINFSKISSNTLFPYLHIFELLIAHREAFVNQRLKIDSEKSNVISYFFKNPQRTVIKMLKSYSPYAITEIETLTLPIFWRNFPWCKISEKKDPYATKCLFHRDGDSRDRLVESSKCVLETCVLCIREYSSEFHTISEENI